MGVKGLWDILSELCERKPLTYLTGKKVAIDLSGWVVQAVSCQGLNQARNPHLRNLYFRVARLLELGVFPVFVTEGKPPALKEQAIKSRNADRYGGNNNSSVSRSYFDRVLKQCENLLCTLGVPCIKSSGEAEAFCAFLCLKGVVSGVITEDNDAFLYGADVVYKDFSVEPNDSHVNVYCLKSSRNKYNLDRKKLVALALLLGCDYSKGVPGIGKETAIKLLNELNCDDVLQRFKDWKNLNEPELFPGLESQPLKRGAHCNRCGHLGSSSKHKKDGCSECDSEFTCYLPNANNPCRCPWHKNDELLNKWKTELKIYKSAMKCEDFPNMEVVDEYLNFNDTIPSDEILEWTCPKLAEFQEITFNMLGWTLLYSFEKVLPIITSWQQYKLQTNDCDKLNFFCEPVEILKERCLRGDSYFEVKWKLMNGNCDMNVPSENLVTTEYGDRFSISYKNLVDEFFQEIKAQKEAKKNARKAKAAKGSRKVKSKSKEKLSNLHISPEVSQNKSALYNQHTSSQDVLDFPKSVAMDLSLKKESSITDSFNGLLDIPLFERIKNIPKPLLQNHETSFVKTPSFENDLVNVQLKHSLSHSSFSNPLYPTLNTRKEKNDVSLSFKIGEKLTLSAKKNYGSEVGKIIFNDSLNNSHVSFPCKNYILDINDDSKIEGMDTSVDEIKKSTPELNTDDVHPVNVENKIYLILSDSDDSESDESFLNILSQGLEYHQNNVFNHDYSKVEDIVNECSVSNDSCTNVAKQDIFSLNIQNISTPLIKKSSLSPSTLYSLKHSISRTQKKVCRRFSLTEIFNLNSPDIEVPFFSRSPSTRLSHTLYSPLVFDSSIDEL